VREGFAEDLAEIERRLEQALDQAPRTFSAIARGVDADSRGCAREITRDAGRLRDRSRAIDADLLVIAARQAPVASDLRLVLALLQLAHHEMLIANQFELIAEHLAEIDPEIAAGAGTAQILQRMASLTEVELRDAVSAFRRRDLELAQRINTEDDLIDQLNRQVCATAVGLDGPAARRELAMRHVLIARSIERIGDNAVDVAEQAAFLVTAELQEFTDASHPGAPSS
jgi:phosphate transport system protein